MNPAAKSGVLSSAAEVAASRKRAPHTSMLVRMLWRAAVLRRGRAASALLSMVVAAAVGTAMLNLYVDVQAKLQSEFRNYGANIILVGRNGGNESGTSLETSPASLPADALTQVDTVLEGRGIAAPFALLVATTSDGHPVVVAGADFDRVKQLDKWWSVSHWPAASHEALIGVRALPVVSPKNQPFDLSFEGRTIHVTPVGSVQTGAAEDSRVYLSLYDVAAWSGVQPSTIEIAATGSPVEIDAVLRRLAQVFPTAEVRPVRQIVEGEARVLGKTRATLVAATGLIILTSALCVLSTLMGWVFDRRRDFAIMKALGASDWVLNGFFAAEAAAMGATGAIIGFVIGIGLAAWIGRANFHAAVMPRFSILPVILAGSIVVTLLSAILPISLLRRVQPAVILRGE